MLLCIDIGNTNIVIGVTDGEAILNDWRLRTEKDITDDELGILIANLFAHSKVHADDIEDIIISCVVPPLLNTMEEFARRYFNVRPLIVGPGLKTGMPIQYDNPREVGADRIVNAVAAYEKYRQAMVIVDFGTATTFDFVSREGAYEGGAIAPGITISCEALFQKASKLPRVELFAHPKQVIAKDTISAMNAGIVHGYAGPGGRHCPPDESGERRGPGRDRHGRASPAHLQGVRHHRPGGGVPDPGRPDDHLQEKPLILKPKAPRPR